MSREIRRVPAGWEHPKQACRHSPWAGGCEVAKESDGTCYVPLFDGDSYAPRVADWKESYAAWERGERSEYAKDFVGEFWDYDGGPPRKEDYMPAWHDSERTHIQMYETCSEGTPISPVMDDPEKLARWLADNGASSFGSNTATYEQWLRVCKGGWAPSAVIANGGLISGVEFQEGKPE